MKPVLTVEGKGIEIYALFYRNSKVHSVTVIDDNGVSKTYHDVNENTQYYTEKPLQIDFNKALTWQERYQPIYEAINSCIDCNQKEIQDLATEIADNLNPFVPSSKTAEREKLKHRTFGLMDAQDIVCEYMEEDVDLSGGEEE